MDNIVYAKINGVELRKSRELETNGEVLYEGALFLDDKEIGILKEDANGGPILVDVYPRYEDVLKSRINDYIKVLGFEDEELPERDIFFLDLIDMQIFYDMFREGVTEGYLCLVVDSSNDNVEIYNVETEEHVEELVREKGLTDFEVFTSPKDFQVKTS